MQAADGRAPAMTRRIPIGVREKLPALTVCGRLPGASVAGGQQGLPRRN
jgi:hypothetical protein